MPVAVILRGLTVFGAVIRRAFARLRLRETLDRLGPEAIDRDLSDAGLSRSDLPTILGGRAHRRTRLMEPMMAHFHVDSQKLAPRYWGALRDAERVCQHCSNSSRCIRWLEWGRRNDAPRVFCPNATLFDEMAQSSRE